MAKKRLMKNIVGEVERVSPKVEEMLKKMVAKKKTVDLENEKPRKEVIPKDVEEMELEVKEILRSESEVTEIPEVKPEITEIPKLEPKIP